MRTNVAPLFGREGDLRALRDRIRSTGLTAIIGAPRIGKSRVLQTLRDDIRKGSRGALVGYVETQYQIDDALLRIVADLYASWVEEAKRNQQLDVLHNKATDYSRQWLSWGSQTLVNVLESTLNDRDSKVTGSVVRTLISSALAPFHESRPGGVHIQALDYERARDLLDAVHEVTGRPIVVMLDQWERSPNIAREGDQLKSFLEHAHQWPTTHVLVASRANCLTAQCAAEIAHEHPMALCMRLDSIDLGDANEQLRLISYLHERCEVTKTQNDTTLLAWIGGNPAVIEQWANVGHSLNDAAALQRSALDAKSNRYPELPGRLSELSDEARRAVMRLVHVMSSDLREYVLKGGESPDAAMEELIRVGLLTGDDTSQFGHATRVDALACVLTKTYPNEYMSQICTMASHLAAQVTTADADAALFAASLASLEMPLKNLLLTTGREIGVASALVASAALLFDRDSSFDVDGASQKVEHDVAALLAMGLVNTLNDARTQKDPDRRDALLDELRALANTHPLEPFLQHLAMGLVSTLKHAEAEKDFKRRDALLDELRALANTHPLESVLRHLAMVLVDPPFFTKGEADLERHDALLDELRALANTHPLESVLHHLAMGLVTTLISSRGEKDRARRAALFDELKALANTHRLESVLEQLAMGLLRTLNDAIDAKNLERRDALLDELRALASTHPLKPVLQHLSVALFNTLISAKAEKVRGRRAALLDELKALANTYSLEPGMHNLVMSIDEIDVAKDEGHWP